MKDGGPAFPCDIESGPNMFGDRAPPQSWEGMSLRDYFAGQALAGLLSMPKRGAESADFAEAAYRQADAMLKARGEV